MANERRDAKVEFHRIMDGIAEYIEQAPGEELLEDAAEAGEDPEETASHVRSVLLEAVSNFKQRSLREARKEYDEQIAAMAQHPYALPVTPVERRTLFESSLAQNQRMQRMVTAQFRNFQDIPDEDVETFLRQFADLGLLDDSSDSKGDTK